MEDSEDDEDLKKAIALSLGDAGVSNISNSHRDRPAGLIDLTGSDDGEAIGSSAESRHIFRSAEEISKSYPASETEKTVTQPQKSSTSVVMGVGGLDRKQMELERLSRLKRRNTISPPPPRKEARLTEAIYPKAPALGKSVSVSSNQVSGLHQNCRTKSDTQDSKSADSLRTSSLWDASIRPRTTSGAQYPLGTVRKTWAFGHPREQDIKIEEVLQSQDLNIAVLSSFQWDVEWLMNKVNLGRTKLMLVMQAKDEATVGLKRSHPKSPVLMMILRKKAQYRTETSGLTNLRLCFPPMDGNVNCMHSKLQLLFHPDYLRIVVPTANLVPYDWGESGSFMENVCKLCTFLLMQLPL
ncbi:MAG: hypothetical protein M1837_005823 [Sclerophora amabilis]|nr:MAG: hypothetical protein M1837_005823 [Sclerophora amabilis]